jgi:hypothetical protein
VVAGDDCVVLWTVVDFAAVGFTGAGNGLELRLELAEEEEDDDELELEDDDDFEDELEADEAESESELSDLCISRGFKGCSCPCDALTVASAPPADAFAGSFCFFEGMLYFANTQSA